ncbi:histone deacetylase A-like protein [Parathielavia appendiculata]|uniref:Histone deacetylase n=1 Tax=Parathielavia appendiculata TaxID=2587402 RepID=A0AAN6TYP9_9PEZI|nr:histone deacetylase A-like protein [Parathielavia appendiculata]
MDDNEKDVVMDGEDHRMADGSSAANRFLDPAKNGEGSSRETSNGQSANAAAQAEDQDSDPTGYPERLRRRGLLPTGCCYDDRMKLHANADFGPNPHHPEDPSRIEYIMKTFKKHGLVFTGSDADLIRIIQSEPTKYMWRIPAREATREEICIVHHPEHFLWVEALSRMTTQELRELSTRMDQGRDSLYVGSMTYEASLISAGGAIETCKSVVVGNVKNAFAVIRPPGHHAEYKAAMGFCLFNNVPIAAKICQADYPELCRKILILDWDVHHGNGIQNMFYDDPNILYISLHVYRNGEFYPGKPDSPFTPDGGIEHCGAGPGLGKNVNIGWHDQGMGDGEYMAAFQKIVMPIAHEFNPDLVIISAGFDAAAGDELGGCFVTPACYAHMTHMLMSLAGGKVAVCLEGGYDLEAISKSALAVAQTLMGEPPPKMEIPRISREAAKVLAKVQAYQAPYWECMRPGIVDVQDMQAQESSRLHDVVRRAQRQVLSEKHGMLSLYIQRPTLFKSFENQVLVTRGIQNARKILLIVHDPPELHAQPDPLDNSIEPHNAWVTDGVTRYIDWAVEKGFGVIDVNVPHYITHPEDTDAFTPRADERTLQAQVQELMCYLWDNYLQLYESAEDIFLMGVGNAYLGIKVLLINRLDVRTRVSGVVNFVNGSLRPVKSDADADLSSWYKEHSQVYVANDHACWSDPDLTRKVMKRRFGNVIRAPVNGLTPMMAEHFADVQRFILERLGEGEGEGEEGMGCGGGGS